MPRQIKTTSEYHRLRGWPKPAHPLISVIDLDAVSCLPDHGVNGVVVDFYSICIKQGSNIKLTYGQQNYDFDSGVMFFMAPRQVFSINANGVEAPKQSGWLLLIHPDFFWGKSLATHIKNYEFFYYYVNEALFLSDKEEAAMISIIRNIEKEYEANIDKFSKNIIISQLETLLNYVERFYNRQFITREKAGHRVLEQLEELLTAYFNSEDLIKKGLPTVHAVAQSLNISPKYLGNMLRLHTGQNVQQHIHEKLIEIAKEKLSATNLSVAEIAYMLGFEYPQSFSKLFKAKTSQTPVEFRASFN